MTDTAVRTIDVLVIQPGSWVAERQTVEPKLADFQRLVGGLIEALSLTDEVSAYINEEGKLVGLPRNEAGDRVVKHALSTVGRRMIPGDYVAGPLVLTGQPDDEGEDTGVPESVVDLLHAAGVKIGTGQPGESAVTVDLPERIDDIEVTLTGRDRRTCQSRLATSIRDDVFLEISTHHDKDRKRFRSTAVGVMVGDIFTRYSLMDFVTVRTEPVARFSEKALRQAHTMALAVVGSSLITSPDTFTGVLLKTPRD